MLGAGVLRSGEPSPPLDRRIRAAIALHKTLEDCVLVCAGGVIHSRPSEASVMRRIALAEGVSESDILLEEKSVNTRQNIQNSLVLIDRLKLRIHIVSDRSHIRRVRLYTALAGIPATFHGVPDGLAETRPARYAATRLYEAAALVKYAAVGLIDRWR